MHEFNPVELTAGLQFALKPKLLRLLLRNFEKNSEHSYKLISCKFEWRNYRLGLPFKLQPGIKIPNFLSGLQHNLSQGNINRNKEVAFTWCDNSTAPTFDLVYKAGSSQGTRNVYMVQFFVSFTIWTPLIFLVGCSWPFNIQEYRSHLRSSNLN